MLKRDQKLAIYMERELTGDAGKMGFGVLRYSPQEIACVIDSEHAGKGVQEIIDTPRDCPVVSSITEAKALGAEVLVLGIAPPGGQIPAEWMPVIDEAVASGLSIINGLHDLLAPRYPALSAGQWVWDVRVEPAGLGVASAKAAGLNNLRVLMIGTDMAIGKMTAGLEIYRAARERGIRTEFVATGQIGITVTGRGVPLDAVRVDFASGAIEKEVMAAADAELIIVEGQGALIHPGSTANLPLLRGSCPTHLILCHKAGQTHLRRVPEIAIPDLRSYCRLYEDLAEACGTFPRPKTCAIALNTSHLAEEEAVQLMDRMAEETGYFVQDPVRFDAEGFLETLELR